MPPESLKRQADDFDAEQQVHKLQRLDVQEAAPPQPQGRKKKATGAIAANSASASRTGQACDRCKTRKIRCDDTHGGCMPCRQNNTECRTTDRVTQRATVRGYTEAVERDNGSLRQQILELEQQVRELGAEPKTFGRYAPVREQYNSQWLPQAGQVWDNGTRSATAYDSPLDTRAGQETNVFAIPSEQKPNDFDGCLGVSSADMSPIKGASLSLFGMRIDISDFVADGPEDSASPASYSTFIGLLGARDGSRSVELLARSKLPETYAEALSYTKWYLSSVNPWAPVLHKPQMMDLVYRWYNQPNFQPTGAEQVMMHIVHAAMKYNMSLRNTDNGPQASGMLDQAYGHYHFAIGLMAECAVGRTIQDLQAMAVIIAHIRSFAKPSTSWVVCIGIMARAIEFGLHRSPRMWASESSKQNSLDVEMGKRVFYTLLKILVSLSGKLGRPMPLRLEDFDCDLPQPLVDSVSSDVEDGSPPRCSWEASIDFFKLAILYLETYNHIYAVRPSGDYEKNVSALEAKLDRWRQELHPSLSEASLTNRHSENRVFALWLHTWEAEFRLLLHHPSLARTSSQDFVSRNLDICMEAASKYIELQEQVRDLKCLDGTWGNAVVFIAAIFTLLFAYWERRDQITSADLAKLRVEMDHALDVIGDVGKLLGTGLRLKEAIRPIIEGGVGQIHRFMVEKTASAAVARAGLHASVPVTIHSRKNAKHAAEAQDLSAVLLDPPVDTDQKNDIYPSSHDQTMMRPHSIYQAAMSAVYPDAGVDPAAAHYYSSFDPSANGYQTIDARMTNQAQVATNPETYIFNHQNVYPPQPVANGVMAWRQWTETLKDDYINHPANALMALTGRELGQVDADQTPLLQDMASAANMHALFGSGSASAHQWPMNAFAIKDVKHP